MVFCFTKCYNAIALYEYQGYHLLCLYVFQLMGMQKDMEKQLSTVVPASIAKEGKRLETSLGRAVEKSIKANIDAFWVRLQEENTKREKADRERMQQLVTLITNSINKDLPSNLEKSLKQEISLLGPIVARAITPIIEKCLTSAVYDSVQVSKFLLCLLCLI